MKWQNKMRFPKWMFLPLLGLACTPYSSVELDRFLEGRVLVDDFGVVFELPDGVTAEDRRLAVEDFKVFDLFFEERAVAIIYVGNHPSVDLNDFFAPEDPSSLAPKTYCISYKENNGNRDCLVVLNGAAFPQYVHLIDSELTTEQETSILNSIMRL